MVLPDRVLEEDAERPIVRRRTVLSIELSEHLADALFVIEEVFFDDDARRLHAALRKQDSLEGMFERMPRLYAIVDRVTLDARGEGVRAFAEELREAGVRMVQYRDKVGSPQEILRACAEIRAVFAGSGATLVMNDRADLAVLAGWDGVHVGQGDLGVEAVRIVLRTIPHPAAAKPRRGWGTREGGVLGVSTHSEEQVRAAEKPTSQNRDVGYPDSGPDYIAVGPVFGTASKADAEPVIGLEGVRAARALTSKPIVAIGGITLANAASVIEAGADAVAVIDGLFVEGRRVGDVARDFLRILG